jgi:hypothetical protein
VPPLLPSQLGHHITHHAQAVCGHLQDHAHDERLAVLDHRPDLADPFREPGPVPLELVRLQLEA